MAEEEEDAESAAQSSLKDEADCEYAWRWSASESTRPVVLAQDRLSVVFHPRRSVGCEAVMGDKPLLRHMEHYFEVKMEKPFLGQARMVGVGYKCARLHSASKDFSPLIGRDSNSWGINYSGDVYHDTDHHKYVSLEQSAYKDGLRVGVYYDSYYGNLSFSINGKSPGIAFQNVPIVIDLYPMICSSFAASKISLTSCHSSVISLKALCRGTVRMYTKEEDIQRLPIPSHVISYLLFHTY